jgi:hypothetical protein
MFISNTIALLSICVYFGIATKYYSSMKINNSGEEPNEKELREAKTASLFCGTHEDYLRHYSEDGWVCSVPVTEKQVKRFHRTKPERIQARLELAESMDISTDKEGRHLDNVSLHEEEIERERHSISDRASKNWKVWKRIEKKEKARKSRVIPLFNIRQA